jgi:hypothetical protein
MRLEIEARLPVGARLLIKAPLLCLELAQALSSFGEIDKKAGVGTALERLVRSIRRVLDGGAAIRQHRGIENRGHYVRDVSFFEDLSRI